MQNLILNHVDLWDELPELLRFRSSSELYPCAIRCTIY